MSEWVKVSERLPMPNAEVLLWRDSWGQALIGSRFADCWFERGVMERKLATPTHWKPMLEGPDEDLGGVTMSDWRPIETAPRDGTLLLLLCGGEDDDFATEDDVVWRTIGQNNFDHDENDEWQMAGWCWSHDHFTEGNGTPVKWMPMPEAPRE